MTRSIKQEIRCHCGTCFEATLYSSVNVKLNPELKRELLDGSLNVVVCPACGEQRSIEIALLYHDMDRRIAIQVFPKEGKDQSTEVEKKMESQAIIRALLSRIFSENGESSGPSERIMEYFDYLANPHIVFGLDELAKLVAKLEEESHRCARRPTNEG